jgi:hypothetical protein
MSLVLALVLAQAPLADELPLERFRVRLERLGDASAPLSQGELETLESELGEHFQLPPPWRFDFDPPADAARAHGAPKVERSSERWIANAHVVAPGNLRLRFCTTLDASFLMLSSVAFIGPDGRTEFSREQYGSRAGFFPLHAFGTVLHTLECEIAALPLDGMSLAHVNLEMAQPLGASPRVRCGLWAQSTAPGSAFEFHVYASLALPPEAAHPAEFAFRGTRTWGNSTIGEVAPAPSLRTAVEDALAARDGLSGLPTWSASARTSWDGASNDVYLSRSGEKSFVFRGELRVERAENAAAVRRWSIAGLDVDESAFRRLLGELDRAREAGEGEVLLVAACAELRRVEAIVRPNAKRERLAPLARALRLELDSLGAPVSFEWVDVALLKHAEYNGRHHWTFELADGARLKVDVRGEVMCAVGEDLRTYATLDGRPLAVVGGAVETTYRR